MSILRAPMLQPPGMATTARPKRESRGPRTAVEARIWADEVIGRLPGVDVGRVDLELVLVDDLDPSADVLEHLAHHVDVGDVGDVGERRHSGSHDGGRHELEGRVLCALDPHRARDAVATLYANDVHVPSVLDRS